ncbi:MAG: hypothetical protein HY824_17270, partial [Acidobacteria bacterium]|nr:hypothetical protein [Acidobacteriota bacterium]
MNAKLGVVVAAVSLVSTAVPAVAHHGFDTEYDAKKKVSLAGVITKVEWTNPHMHVYIDVADTSGKVTNWNMEMASPNTVQRQGWGRNALLPGDKVVFDGFGGKVVESRGALSRISKADSRDKPL